MLFELLRRKNILAVRLRRFDIAAGFIKRIHDQRAAHFDRLAAVDGIKHQSTAEAPRRGRHALAHHRVGPHGHDLHRGRKFAVFSGPPRNSLVQIEIEFRAAGRKRDEKRRR
ncbi:MAG: hypothetical protein JNL96_25735 [Planctomycetaceae bacterium]|nr:hypothetical protein [Planctomycetaceae bacterium]